MYTVEVDVTDQDSVIIAIKTLLSLSVEADTNVSEEDKSLHAPGLLLLIGIVWALQRQSPEEEIYRLISRIIKRCKKVNKC